jgi:hypothetical protein
VRRDEAKVGGSKTDPQNGASTTSSLDGVEGLHPYLRSYYQRAAWMPGIRGRVFIVGGTEHEALACLALGADEVFVANPWFAQPWYRNRISGFANPKVHLIGTVAEKVELEAGSVDRVLSACVVEHIRDIPAVLEKSSELLRPGGRAQIYGGPVWTGPRGHHLWVIAEDGTEYFFDDSGDEQPVKDWEHLLCAPAELGRRLVERGLPEDHAAKILEHIFSSRTLNRLSPTEIEEMVIASTLHSVSFKRIYEWVPPEEISAALSEKVTLADLSTWAVEFLLEKRAATRE